MTRISTVLQKSTLPALLGIALCGSGCEEKLTCPEPTLDLSVCDPGAGPFSLVIDNPYLPMVVGQQSVLEGSDEGTSVRVEITVLDATEVVAGVVTRVVEEAEYEEGEIAEISRNYFAQAPDGTVCYFGEEVDVYSGGQVTGHPGSWRAGEGANLPGIFMPAAPAAGQAFYQESAPGIAEDMSEILETGATITVPAGTFSDALRVHDFDPLGGCEPDAKAYAPGVGLIQDGPAKLVSY